jgi:glyoxalase/bleomycin resistance protein/dioxygenase superfamily protein
MTPSLVALHIADDPAAWEEIGFTVEGDTCLLGTVELRFVGRGAGRGLTGWTLSGASSTDLDGLDTAIEEPLPPRDAPAHANGAIGLDHVVVFTPGFDRTLAALEAAGFEVRRIAEIGVEYAPVKRAFYRLGSVVLEVVDQPRDDIDPAGPAFFWGLAVTVSDIESLADRLGERNTSGVRDAIQPGRRIVPLSRTAGLSLPVAFMSPEPARR